MNNYKNLLIDQLNVLVNIITKYKDVQLSSENEENTIDILEDTIDKIGDISMYITQSLKGKK